MKTINKSKIFQNWVEISAQLFDRKNKVKLSIKNNYCFVNIYTNTAQVLKNHSTSSLVFKLQIYLIILFYLPYI